MISDERFITNSNSRKDVHQMRSTHQLLITGINTIKIDNPFLNVRFSADELGLKEIKNPNVLILGNNQSISKHEEQMLNVFKVTDRILYFEKLTHDFTNLPQIIQKYLSKQYKKIMVEAGPTLSKAFLDSGLIDELIVYSASENIENTLQNFYPNNFKLIKKYEMKGLEKEKNNLKAIFCTT
jgi:diaminohydroxyphosphoribosylaminopyrimidine deaminase / 5-amino-6-(5-phosphoribosylamino)uracil reductase